MIEAQIKASQDQLEIAYNTIYKNEQLPESEEEFFLRFFDLHNIEISLSKERKNDPYPGIHYDQLLEDVRNAKIHLLKMLKNKHKVIPPYEYSIITRHSIIYGEIPPEPPTDHQYFDLWYRQKYRYTFGQNLSRRF